MESDSSQLAHSSRECACDVMPSSDTCWTSRPCRHRTPHLGTSPRPTLRELPRLRACFEGGTVCQILAARRAPCQIVKSIPKFDTCVKFSSRPGPSDVKVSDAAGPLCVKFSKKRSSLVSTRAKFQPQPPVSGCNAMSNFRNPARCDPPRSGAPVKL